MPNDMTILLTYGFLYLSVIFLWIPAFKSIPLWRLALGVAIAFGVISHRIDGVGLGLIVLLFGTTFCLSQKKWPLWIRVLSAVILFVLGLGLGLSGIHGFLPGFHNLLVLNHVQISHNGIPFSLYLNFDKTIVGLCIIGILHQRIKTDVEWRRMFQLMMPGALWVIVGIACLAFALQFVTFDLKVSQYLPIWAITNLLFVCLAEEGFFRGFIQKYISLCLRRLKYGDAIAISIAAILFGLSHFMGGPRYVLLATVAGLGYGWIYCRTQRIEAAMLTHFSLNLVHFLCFTYPALAA